MKRIIAVLLSLTAGITVFWSWNPEQPTNLTAQPLTKQKLKVESPEKLARQFQTQNLYQINKSVRESPFLTSRSDRAEFSYSQPEENKPEKKAKADEPNKQPAAKANQIKQADLNLYLSGIVKDKGRTLIIVNNQQESYVLEQGDTIKDHQVVNINQDKILVKKEGQLYYLQSRLKVFGR